MVDKTHELIAHCRAMVAASPTHHLPLEARKRLWASFGEPLDWTEVQAGAVSAGHLRRGRLAIYAVRSVLAGYAEEEVRSGDELVNPEDHPAKILDAAERRLNGVDDWTATGRTAYRYGNMLQYLYELWPAYRVASLILLGAGGAIGACLDDYIGFEQNDEGPDAQTCTADMYACLAFCNGVGPWDRDEGQRELDTRREAFWLQYLAKASELAA